MKYAFIETRGCPQHLIIINTWIPISIGRETVGPVATDRSEQEVYSLSLILFYMYTDIIIDSEKQQLI